MKQAIVASRQLPLPLDTGGADEPSFRTAYARSRLRQPFEAAVRSRALAICLRCYAESLQSRRQRARTTESH